MDFTKYEPMLMDRTDLGAFATFVPNKFRPVYNWFYYKEGFSKELVNFFLDASKPNRVLDPFCGSGTTLLACKQRGINAIGFDAMPISVFSSLAKTQDYNTEELEILRKRLISTKFREIKTQFPKFFYRYFSRYALNDVAFLLSELGQIDSAAKPFFHMALINSAVKASYAFKDGAVLKVRKHNIPLRKMFGRVTARMIKDLEGFEKKPCKIRVEQGDARRLAMEDGCVDAVITSPPYLNNIDYTKVYSIENWFVGMTEPAIRSFIGGATAEDFLGLGFPPFANAYFMDMQLSIKEMHRVCKPGAKAAIVVGNAYLSDADIIVDSDLILSALAEEIGFSIKEILVLNKRYALEGRTIKKGVLRESAVVMEKK